MTFKIEKGVPIPGPQAAARLYPFGDMEIGDSFLVPADHPGAARFKGSRAPKVMGAASAFGKANGKRFASRAQPDGSVRVWRLPDPEPAP